MRASLILAVAFAAIALPLSGASAAPQILGLIASNGTVPLTCDEDSCTVELSSFCLQRERPVPAAGTVYRPAGGVRLVLTGSDGTRRTLAAGDLLHFASERNYTAVTARLPAEALARLGAVTAAVAIDEGAALLPLPVAGDQDPQSEADISIALAARRGAGSELVDRSSTATAAHALGRVVNALSPDAHGRMTPRDALWQAAVKSSGADPDGAGLSRAASLYESCLGRPGQDSDAALRWCLQLRHDALILELNGDYWDALETGS